MLSSWTIGQKLALGFALPLIILGLLGFFSYRSTQQLLDTSARVTHTHQVLTDLSEILSDLQDVETGQRGYVLTGKEEFLGPYHSGRSDVTKHLEHVKQLTSDNPLQQERIARLSEDIDAKVDNTAASIAARRDKGIEAGTQSIADGQGKAQMDAIRKTIAEMTDEENKLLERRDVDAKEAADKQTSVLFGGTLAAIVVVSAAALLIVGGLGKQIGGLVQRMQSAAAELEAAATQQTRGAKEQSQTTTEVSTTSRQLVSTARQIAGSAQRVTQLGGETAQAARNGERTVAAATEAILGVRSEVQRIVDHMVHLGRKSHEIGGILDIINELSEQTNILAINATIEAVGAGDAGRRFGVVASEIRNLADRVGSATKEIRRLIEEIRGAANTTVMATEDGAKAVENGTRRFGELTESFKRIVDYVASTADASREIELSTQQQTSAMEQMSAAIGEVAGTARETAASSGQTLQTASEIVVMSRELSRLVRKDARELAA
ncbi:CHASE3 domain-containing protein [Polyangium sp. 15x6]|uniref:CHASE3 domain-containing protein n=1 Tax=Polyangium sp. 15x6 TaxID=3042687 RepID=UPI00249B8C19|nr:CHASE3 domain-containing protein [Polyangium sp. 15x6]MDI3291320.1 CHASE3 domain-containing protein [Polyangium sp. 15x6]